MTAAKKLLSTQTGGDKLLYVDDVFSTYLYTGNGSTKAINNGIDLAGKGGLVWFKQRNAVGSQFLYDSVQGTGHYLFLNESQSSFHSTWKLTFTSNGYTDSWGWSTNQDMVSWTFRKAPKFFDVVTYTGNGVAGRQIPHSLGVVPGMIIVKRTDSSGDWLVQARVTSSSSTFLKLNSSGSASSVRNGEILYLGDHTVFLVSPGGTTDTNINGATYVAYLFAHDPSADGIIQCGSYTGNGSATGPIVNLGWEPQYLMIKNASGTGNWQIIDNMRGMPVGSADATLQANLSNAESSVDYVSPTATGFQVTSSSSEVNTSGSTYVYMAIRRPNKPPTTGTQVYNAIARTGTGAAATITGVGFAPDLLIASARNVAANNGGSTVSIDKLRGGGALLQCGYTVAEASGLTDQITSFDVGGVTLGADTTYGRVNYSTLNYINHFFKRAPGVFDVVCYTGNNASGGDADTHFHGLGTMPELIIVKARTTTTNNNWGVIYTNGAVPFSSSNGQMMGIGTLSSTTMGLAANFTVTTLTATKFEFSRSQITSNSDRWFDTAGVGYVAYFFATKAGISKVGSYTGNGSSQTIDCGFTAGARFILIKRIDSTGDWYVWDTVRGIVAANDPHLSLNTTAAEITTDDSVDPYAGGFIVNQNIATNININGKQYIFLAIA